MKVLVAVSVSREWSETDFLQQMGAWKIPDGCQIKFGWHRQFTAQERHNVALNEAKYNYDRLIFMDTDQIYPPDYIDMMLAHDEPVVTGLNVSRYYPFEFTVYKVTGEQFYEQVPYLKFETMKLPNKAIFECDLTGTGAMMIDPKILDEREIELPYFKDIFASDGCRRIVPDDFYFCSLLYRAGIKITVDRNIMVKHIAKMIASPLNTRELKLAWEKVNSGHGYWKDGKK